VLRGGPAHVRGSGEGKEEMAATVEQHALEIQSLANLESAPEIIDEFSNIETLQECKAIKVNLSPK
jgi:hypothetical protein